MNDQYFEAGLALVRQQAIPGTERTLESEAWLIYQMTRAAIRAEWAAARAGLYPPATSRTAAERPS